MNLLIAARSKQVMSALRDLVDQSGYHDFIAEVLFYKDFMKHIKLSRIDLVLLDWDFFDKDTIEMIRFIKKLYPDTKFIILGMQKKNKKEADEAKINSFFLKSDSPKDLLKMIDDYRRLFRQNFN